MYRRVKECCPSHISRQSLQDLRAFALFAVLILVSATSGCGPGPEGEGPGHRRQSLALTPRQELELGQEAYQEILSKSRVVSSGPEVDQVRRVGKRISSVVSIEPLMREINLHVADYRFEWEYSVLDDPQINAFCLPGGKICVFTGLLRVVSNDDQLAAVLAHEVSHALAHHVSERIARERMVGHGLLALHYDRQQESEADHIGVFLMTFAGYDPQQAVVFWQKMERLHGSDGLPAILSDHPSDEQRMEQLERWVPMALAAKKAFEEGRVLPANSRTRQPAPN
jgi:predicted Zn-dependent protease